jgi:hypothetical protein
LDKRKFYWSSVTLSILFYITVFTAWAWVLLISVRSSDAGKFQLKIDEAVWFVELSVPALSVLCFILAGPPQWFLSRTPSCPLICWEYLRRQAIEFRVYCVYIMQWPTYTVSSISFRCVSAFPQFTHGSVVNASELSL